MSKSKLELVLEYLMNEQEDKAKALLHDIFIEKARAIHESIIEEEDEEEEDGKPMDSIGNSLKMKQREIDAEGNGNMGESFEDEDDDTEVDLGDDEDDGEVAGFEDEDEPDNMVDAEDEDEDEGFGELEDKMNSLSSALEDLKAAFEELTDHEDHEDHEEMDPTLGGDQGEDFRHDVSADEDEDEDTDEALNEFDEFMESLELEVVEKDLYSGKTKSREVGNGPKFATPDSVDHSPVPKSQTDRMGARPVKTGQGPKVSGYDRPSTSVGYARKSADEMVSGGQRRKKSTDGLEQIGTGYGKTKSMKGSKLESDSDFKTGKADSPFTRGPRR